MRNYYIYVYIYASILSYILNKKSAFAIGVEYSNRCEYTLQSIYVVDVLSLLSVNQIYIHTYWYMQYTEYDTYVIRKHGCAYVPMKLMW